MPTDRNGNYTAGSTRSDQSATTEFDRDIGQFIPWDLTGSRGRMQAETDAARADLTRGYADALNPGTAAQYDSQVGQDAESTALQQMQQWSSGQLTGADRSGLETQRQRDAQASGAQQQSLMQQAQARGVGGSGIDFATRQQAAQQGQQMASDAESQALMGAQQRGLQATDGSAALGSRMRQEAGQGQQRVFDNQRDRAALAMNQYGQDSSNTQAERDRRARADDAAGGFISGLLD